MCRGATDNSFSVAGGALRQSMALGDFILHSQLLFRTDSFRVMTPDRMDDDARVFSLQKFEIPF
jgi:hypothetical protein